MELLILVRHGEYGSPNRSLNGDGHRQINHLAKVLSSYIEGKRTIILSSTAKRATDTSEVLVRRFRDIPIETHECLTSTGEDLDGMVEETIELVRRHESNYDVVILSTHLPHVSDFPTIWAELFGNKVNSDQYAEKGSARVYNMQNGTVTEIPALCLRTNY